MGEVLSAPSLLAQRYILILGNSRENVNVENSCVTVKICIVDEAASEAVAAWECMDNKPIDETELWKVAQACCEL